MLKYLLWFYNRQKEAAEIPKEFQWLPEDIKIEVYYRDVGWCGYLYPHQVIWENTTKWRIYVPPLGLLG